MRHHLQITLRAIFLFVLCLTLSGIAFGQEITGSIVGSVKDSSGAAVSGAPVTITDSGTKIIARTTTSNDEGQFSARNLTSALYDITVEAPNFKKHLSTGLKLDVGQIRTVDVSLEAGNISEVVTVEATALAVQLTTPTASTVISGAQVRELSLNNRNWVQLVALAPGVSNLRNELQVQTPAPAPATPPASGGGS